MMRTLVMLALLSLLLMPAGAQAQSEQVQTFVSDFTVPPGNLWGWEIENGVGPYTGTPPTGVGSVNSMGTELVELTLNMNLARLYGFRIEYSAALAHDLELWLTMKDGSSARYIYLPLMTGGDHMVEETWANRMTLLDVVQLRVVILNATLFAGTDNFWIKRITILHSGPAPGVFEPAQYSVGIPDIIDALNRGNQNLMNADASIAAGLMPAETGDSLFRYVKWLISPSSADEIAGPFAPAISHAGMALNISFILGGLYLIIYVGIYLIRFAIWLFKLILAIVQTIIGAIGAILNFLPF